MDQFSKILVAIRDPSRRSQRALTKAARLATSTGARLELFHAISGPLYDDPVLFAPDALIRQEEAVRAAHLKRLERLAAPLRKQGLSVTCAATWDFPAAHAIVRQSVKSGADLIVADGRATHTGRWFLRFTDWELLRLSALPVLLVKGPGAYASVPTILAALDPSHAGDKPARLDVEILECATKLRALIGGKLQAVHAYVPGAIGIQPKEMAKEGFAQRLEARSLARASRCVDRELRLAGLKDITRHLVELHPVDAIPATAHKVHADIVVMGAISRSGVKRVLIGNTAEDVLDELQCDVLIVKPRGFARRVSQETRGPDIRPLLTANYV